MSEVDLQPPEDEGHSHQSTAPLRAKSFFKIGKIGLEVVLITAGVFLGLLGEGWRENAEHRGLADASLRRSVRNSARTRRRSSGCTAATCSNSRRCRSTSRSTRRS